MVKQSVNVKENQIVSVSITDVTSEGQGIGRVDGMVVMVPSAFPGDVCDVRVEKVGKSAIYGSIDKITSPSMDRIESKCPYFPMCGGCTFQNLSYDAETKIKENWVRESIERISGTDIPVNPIICSPKESRYRNKAIYQAGKDKVGNLVFGFYKTKSHEVISVSDCLLQPEEYKDILQAIKFFCKENKISVYDESRNTGLLRAVYLRKGMKTGEIGLTLILNGNKLPKTDLFINLIHMQFPQISSIVLNTNREKTNVVLGKEYKTLFGKDSIRDILCDKTFDLSPASFYQVNHDCAEILYSVARDYAQIEENETLMDFYCGTGTIGLCMIKEKGKLIGVEIVPEAVLNAENNARLNHQENATFYCGDAGKLSKKLSKQNINTDVLIVDPPRKGCSEEMIDTIGLIHPKRLVYVSCGHSTLARDIKLLKNYGYVPLKIQPVDMFPRTCGVECVALLKSEANET